MAIGDESEIEASRAPLLDHLTELRNRLIICMIALVLGFALCFSFAEAIFTALLHPYQVANGIVALQKASGHSHPFSPDLVAVLFGQRALPEGSSAGLELIFTAPLEAFIAKVKLAAFGAIALTLWSKGKRDYHYASSLLKFTMIGGTFILLL